jgi:ComF family protein
MIADGRIARARLYRDRSDSFSRPTRATVARFASPQDVAPRKSATLATRAGRWLNLGLDLVFPPSCALCHCPLENRQAELLCSACRAEVIEGGLACVRCGSTVVSDVHADATSGCPRCKKERLHFHGVVRLGVYQGTLRSAVLRIKKQHERPLALALGELLARSNDARWTALRPDAVVPIPMHWTRKIWRGTNSPETIAERLARHLDIPLASHLLVRCRRTAPQASLSPSKRLANVRGAFRAARHADLPGARLLLVDDIMTTGATVNEAAKMLTRAGAAFVGVVVPARAEGRA